MIKTFAKKKSLIYFVSALLLTWVSWTSLAAAESVMRGGETVSLAEEHVVEGDFYAASGKVNISGSVEQDLLVISGQTTINGTVGEDAFLIGGQVDVHGPVNDDLRIISGNITIADVVAGNVMVVGGSVNILSTASIEGDVLIFAGEVMIEGYVGGDIVGTAGKLRIDAPVAGNVDVTTENLTLGDRANIEGTVRYTSTRQLVQSLNAIVVGEVVRNDIPLPNDTNFLSAFAPLLFLLFSVLVWYLISRHSLNLVSKRAVDKGLRAFLIGSVVLIMSPVAISILMASVIGVIVGMVALLSYLLIILLSIICLPAVLGKMLMMAFNQPYSNVSLIIVIVGVLGVGVSMVLPIFGLLIFLLLMIVSMGSMVDLIIEPK